AKDHTNQRVDAEAQARADGDAATLASAKDHTNQRVDAEAQARADGDAATLASAKSHTEDYSVARGV
ncbi:hypothetical protein SBW04_32430, partial [Pseudomonas aeruginosa]|nr:hypothetical protein [Pseudomonas aeruginosa]